MTAIAVSAEGFCLRRAPSRQVLAPPVGGARFFVDACLSPTSSRHLNQGRHDPIHPHDRGRLRDPDHVVFARAIEEDRIIDVIRIGRSL